MKVKFKITKEEAGDTGDYTEFAAVINQGYSNGNIMDDKQLQDAATKNIKNISLSIRPLKMVSIETKSFDFDVNGSRTVGIQNLPVILYDYKYWVESIPYEVVKIIDAQKYLLIEPETNEIIEYSFDEKTKVFLVSNEGNIL